MPPIPWRRGDRRAEPHIGAPNRRQEICVDAVAPGIIETRMEDDLIERRGRNALLSTIPLGRLGQSEDVAGVIAFPLSDDASYITGQMISALSPDSRMPTARTPWLSPRVSGETIGNPRHNFPTVQQQGLAIMSTSPSDLNFSEERILGFYREMQRIRRIEEQIGNDTNAEKISGAVQRNDAGAPRR